METKANNILVGLFLLTVFFGLFGYIYWSQSQKSDRVNAYEIVFSGNVSGLSTASKVLFNGLNVGHVDHIRINPKDGRQTIVGVKIRGNLPLRENSQARLKTHLVTGASDVMISPGTPTAKALPLSTAEKNVRIQAATIAKTSLLQSAPDFMSNANSLVVRMNDLVANNEILVHETVKNMRSFTETLEANKQELTLAMRNTRELTEKLNSDMSEVMANAKAITKETKEGVAGVISSVQGMTNELKADVDHIMKETKTLTTSLNSTATQVAGLVEENGSRITRTVKNMDLVVASVTEKREDISQILSNTRNLTQKAGALTDKLDSLISENGETLANSLKNVQDFTLTLAENKESVAQVMQNAKTITDQFKSVATKLDRTINDFSGVVENAEGESIFRQAQQTVETFKKLATKLDASFGNSSGELSRSIKTGVRDFQGFMRDARQTVRNLNRVIEQVEKHPIMGAERVPEYGQ